MIKEYMPSNAVLALALSMNITSVDTKFRGVPISTNFLQELKSNPPAMIYKRRYLLFIVAAIKK
jgi:hypothetical protein